MTHKRGKFKNFSKTCFDKTMKLREAGGVLGYSKST